jgi:hypothetical protein
MIGPKPTNPNDAWARAGAAAQAEADEMKVFDLTLLAEGLTKLEKEGQFNPNADALARRRAKEPRIKDMKVGSTGWAVPWAFDSDVRKLRADYTLDSRPPIETISRMLMITRMTDSLFRVKVGTVGPVYSNVVLLNPDTIVEPPKGCSCVSCDPDAAAKAKAAAEGAAWEQAQALIEAAAKREAGKAAFIKASKEAQDRITAQIEAREAAAAKAEADKVAEDILKAGKPPAWDPLGVAPFAWTLPEPGPAPAPPRGKVRTYFDGQNVMANIYLVVAFIHVLATIAWLLTGHPFNAALDVGLVGLWMFNVHLARKNKADRERRTKDFERWIKDEEDPTW